MAKTPRFTQQNTIGFPQSVLDEMNVEFDQLAVGVNGDAAQDALAESVLRNHGATWPEGSWKPSYHKEP